MNLAVLLCLTATLTSAPKDYRGVVEGYYGRPWGTEGRIGLMSFMAERGLNTFVYGPKDDPYHHAKWREPYPEKEARDFQRLLDAAGKNGIHFFWAIHLGNFKGEYDRLFAKLESMYALGVRAFAVFFDDFGSADASLHAVVGNRIIAEFLDRKGDCEPLLVCPNDYYETGHPYHREIGAKLDPRAMIMWTGMRVVSDIRAADVARITADYRRPPFIWFNWPVNDFCRSKLLLGPLYGVEACPVAGFVLNPMENCEANRIAVNCFAKWCADPKGFVPQKAWEETFPELFRDAEVAAAMRVFAEHNSDQGMCGNGYHRAESVADAPLCRAARAEAEKTGALGAETAARVRALFDRLGGAAAVLAEKLPAANPKLAWEMEGWLAEERHQMELGRLALDLLGERDAARRSALVRRVVETRARQRADRARHMDKFRAATFKADAAKVCPPNCSDTEVEPLVAGLLAAALKGDYFAATGKSFAEMTRLEPIKRAKGFPELVPFAKPKVVGIQRVFGGLRMEPGDWYGLTVPPTLRLTAASVRMNDPKALAAAVLEVSRDGRTWTKLAAKVDGRYIRASVPADARLRRLRCRNAGGETVDMNLHAFRLSVVGETDPIDVLLAPLAQP